jgi:DNA-directed RNA polymerase beta subunit
LLIGFMPWNGYNFEDSILIRLNALLAEDRYLGVLNSWSWRGRDTKLGSEGCDIPTCLSSNSTVWTNPASFMSVREIQPGDTLVGKGHAEEGRNHADMKKNCCVPSLVRRPAMARKTRHSRVSQGSEHCDRRAGLHPY